MSQFIAFVSAHSRANKGYINRGGQKPTKSNALREREREREKSEIRKINRQIDIRRGRKAYKSNT